MGSDTTSGRRRRRVRLVAAAVTVLAVTFGVTVAPRHVAVGAVIDPVAVATPFARAFSVNFWCPESDAVGTADFNGDRRDDAWCFWQDVYNNRTLMIATSRGDGTFLASVALTGWCSQYFWQGTADFDGGGADPWCFNPKTGEFWVALRNATGKFVSHTIGQTWCRSVGYFPQPAFADFNHDQRTDFFCRELGYGTAGVWTSNGDGTFTPWPTRAGFCYRDVNLAALDLNGDGDAETFCHEPRQGGLVLAFTNGHRFTRFATALTGWCGSGNWPTDHVGDVNGDMLADVVCANNLGHIRVARSTGTTLVRSGQSLDGWCIEYFFSGLADFNGDGLSDIVCHDKYHGILKTRRSDGQNFLPFVDRDFCWSTVSSGAVRFGTADFNGDGKSDLWCQDIWARTFHGRFA